MERIRHLTYFQVENFKQFEKFELNDIGQFNLIVGDNNIGKTSVLEALTFDEDKFQMAKNLITTLSERKIIFDLNLDSVFKNLNIIKEFVVCKNAEDHKVRFSYVFADDKLINRLEYEEKSTKEISNEEINLIKKDMFVVQDSNMYFFSRKNNNEVEVIPADLNYIQSFASRYIPFVPFYLGYGSDLLDFYSEKVQNSKILKKQFVKNLQLFIPLIEDIEISIGIIPEQPILAIRLKNNDGVMPLASFGLGAVKLFRLILEIYQSKNYRLMIDEIDTGIHYSRFQKFIEILLNVAIENNVQLFASTHNWECIKYFNLAIQNIPNTKDKARSYTLRRLEDNYIKSYVYNYDEFNYAVTNEHEIRGE